MVARAVVRAAPALHRRHHAANGVIMRILRILLVIVIALVATFGYRWYAYVTNTESPYNEVGIELNSRMPMPIRKWGCDKLHATFGNAVPPYGCQAPDDPGRGWI
jgi:hypothetical protein